MIPSHLLQFKKAGEKLYICSKKYFSSCTVHNKQLTFRCENSKPRVPVKREGGIGLANVKRRLDLLYESRYTLQIEDKETTYNVNLHLNS